MGREFGVSWVGRHQRDDWEALCAGYRSRIEAFFPVRDQAVRSKGAADDPRRLETEGHSLLASLPDPAWVIALDRRGRQQSSEHLGRSLIERIDIWPHPIVFLIGSDLGLSEAALERADQRLSLGSLTLPHTLARLVLYEQMYRVLCIRAGINYHRRPL